MFFHLALFLDAGQTLISYCDNSHVFWLAFQFLVTCTCVTAGCFAVEPLGQPKAKV